jgi:hypothetical protein
VQRAVEAAERRRRLLHRVRAGARPVPHPIALTPFVVPRHTLPALRRLAATVHGFQAEAPDLYRAGRLEFRRICPLDPTTEAWLHHDGQSARGRRAGGGDLMIRLDVGLGADGSAVLYESNSTALAGLFNHTTGVEILSRVVLPRLFSPAERRGLKAPPDLLALTLRWVAGAAHRRGLGRGRRPGVAFVEPSGPGDGYSELPAIARYFAAQGARARVGDPRALRVRGERVLLGAVPVDLAYRDVNFADLGPPPVTGRELAGFMELLRRRAVIPGMAGEFDHKGLLECLTSPAYRRFFGGRARQVLARCVPWTRVLWERTTEGLDGGRVDLVRHVLRGKDRLVIKPNRGSSGEGVLIGQRTTAARWERRLHSALAHPGRWVVQAWVEPTPRPMVFLQSGALHSGACYASLGLFYVPGRLGLHCRVSRFQVVNVARGGALACAFVG